MRETEDQKLLRIYPLPGGEVPLHGLYLREPLAPPEQRSKSFVYTNFIASLDGRISLPDPRTNKRTVPRALSNPRDWRLFQELAATADALVTSGQYVRDLRKGVSARSFPVSAKPEFADLLRWRRDRGLAPQPAVVIVSASLDLPRLTRLAESGRSVYVATGRAADPRKVASLESDGARVLRVGAGTRVEGGRLIEALAQEAHWNIAMIGGGEVLRALLADDVLDRLYLTLACRLLGGLSFDTLLTGPVLEPATRFRLAALHYDAEGTERMARADGSKGLDGTESTAVNAGTPGTGIEQLFAILDRADAVSGDGKRPEQPSIEQRRP